MSGVENLLPKFMPISFFKRASRFLAFQTKVAHLCFCLVRKQKSYEVPEGTQPSPKFSELERPLRGALRRGSAGFWRVWPLGNCWTNYPKDPAIPKYYGHSNSLQW